MKFFNAEIKILDTELFLQYSIDDLNSGNTIYCFVQSGEAFYVKGNNYTHI